MVDTIHYENRDCVEAMKEYPDNYFDLAIVDPPYGNGLAENGGCKGWFSKYHQDSSQSVKVERERENLITVSGKGSTDTKRFVRFNNAGRQARYASKKSYRGTLPQRMTISKSYSVFHETKLFGAATTFLCRQQGVLWFGAKRTSPQRGFQWRRLNTHGQVSNETPKYTMLAHQGNKTNQNGYTLVKNPFNCICGC